VVANFGAPIDLHNQELRNALAQNLGADPATLSAGLWWLDTVNHLLKWYDGTKIVDPLNRTNHSGTQGAATISDLTSAVQALRWASMTAPNAAVAMAGQNFTGLGTASGNGQAVEFAQFQAALAQVATGMDLKETQATVVATTNVVTTAPGATISGHAMANGDSVLLTAQTTPSQNGLWSWTAPTSAMTRRADASGAGSILAGTMVVIGGADGTNPDTVWMQTATGTGTGGAIVPGTDAQTWVKVLSPQILTGSSSISITAGVVAVILAAGGGLSATGGGLAVDTTKVASKFHTTITANGTDTSWTVTHGLGTANPVVSVRIAGARWITDDSVPSGGTSTTQITIGISPAPAAGTVLDVTVIG
jgi:hypothetical protein